MTAQTSRVRTKRAFDRAAEPHICALTLAASLHLNWNWAYFHIESRGKENRKAVPVEVMIVKVMIEEVMMKTRALTHLLILAVLQLEIAENQTPFLMFDVLGNPEAFLDSASENGVDY